MKDSRSTAILVLALFSMFTSQAAAQTTFSHDNTIAITAVGGGEDLLTEGAPGGEFRPVTQDPADEQQHDTNRAHFTASKNRHYGLKTIAEASKASIRKSSIDKADGINRKDRSRLARGQTSYHDSESA